MNFKKVLILILTVLTVTSLGLFVACHNGDDNSSNSSSPSGEVTLSKIEYVSGIPEVLVRGTTPDYTELKIKATYSDNHTEEIAYNQADFNVTVDTRVKAESVPVTIVYKEKTATTNVKVDFEIAAVGQPEFVINYDKNVGEDSIFKDNTKEYVVGASNAFYYVPVVTVLDSDVNPYTFDKSGDFEIVAKVYKKVGGVYTLLQNPESEVEIDTVNASFKFAPAAIGNSYKLVVRPAEVTAEQLAEEDGDYEKEFSFRVADLYNVYSAAELLLWDNRSADDADKKVAAAGLAVKTFRESKGVTIDPNSIKGLALHCDLSLGKDDIAPEFIYDETRDSADFAGLSAEKKAILNGSLKDEKDLLVRKFDETGTFVLEGNYHTVSAEKLPLVVRGADDKEFKDDPKSVVSHTVLLTVEGKSKQESDNFTEYGALNNVNFIGNLNRQDDVWSGGCILFDACAAKTDIYNVVASRWYSTVFADTNTEARHVVLNKVDFKDNYNCIIYLWGGIITIKESTIKGAGGPVIIGTHASVASTEKGRDGKGGWIAKIYVDSASELESTVTGQEGWFAEMGAQSAAAQIIAMDGLFTPFNRTFTTGSKSVTEDGKEQTLKTINLVAIFREDGAYGLTFGKIGGYAKIGDGDNAHVFDYDNQDTAGVLDAFKGKGAPVIQSSLSGIIAYMGNDSNSIPQIAEPLKTGAAAIDFMATVQDPSKYPQIFKDTGYLNVFYGSQGSEGYLGILLGNYRAVKAS